MGVKNFFGEMIMMIGLLACIFTGGCTLLMVSIMLMNDYTAILGALVFVMIAGFPFLISYSMFVTGKSMCVQPTEYKPHDEPNEECMQQISRPGRQQPDEQAEKIDADPEFFNSP